MWMQTFWSHLNETGTAGFVIANGAMTSNSKGEGNVRKFMVENNIIDCIVRMPDKLFMTTGIPAALFFLSKNRSGLNGTHRERSNEIMFIDASKMGEMATRRLRVFSDDDIQKIAGTYHKWRTQGERYEDIPGFCKAATIEDVKANDYKLTPGIYVGTEEEEDDGIPFEVKMAGLKAKLQEQFEKSNELQERIIKNLNDL
jgi:type I restriction enzyme M protein